MLGGFNLDKLKGAGIISGDMAEVLEEGVY